MKNHLNNYPDYLHLTPRELYNLRSHLTSKERLNRFLPEAHNVFHMPIQLEQEFYFAIRDGNEKVVKDILEQNSNHIKSAAQKCELRWAKNNAICHITLLTRASILGGMSAYRANFLSDIYIQNIELATDIKAILYISYQAIFECLRCTSQYNTDRKLSPGILACINYIDEHLTEKIKIDDLSAKIGFSSRQLSRKFKIEIGRSIHQYIIEERLHTATYILRFTDWEIIEVAQSLGFSSESHFISIFRKNIGQTPDVFRKSTLFL